MYWASLFNFSSSTSFNLVYASFSFIDIANNEKVVNSTTGIQGDISSVFSDGVPDPVVVAEYGLNIPQSLSLIRTMFVVSSSELAPYEYRVDKEDGDKYNEIFSQIEKPFLTEWIQVLERSGMKSSFGLALLGNGGDVMRLEESYPDKRVSITRPISNKEVEDGYVHNHLSSFQHEHHLIMNQILSIRYHYYAVWSVSDEGVPRVCCGCRSCPLWWVWGSSPIW